MGAALGPALAAGGEALLSAFWRVPALALALATGILLIGRGVPDLPASGTPGISEPVEVGAAE
jgi:hypothetical protein